MVFERARSRPAGAGEGAVKFTVDSYGAYAGGGRRSVFSSEAEGGGALDEGPGSLDVTDRLGGIGQAGDLICREVGSDTSNAGGGALVVGDSGSPRESGTEVRTVSS